MSRSIIKHNIIKSSPNISNKLARSKANRKFRRHTKMLINMGEYFLPKRLKEISDVWDFPTDGLATYFPILSIKWQRR